MAEQEPRAHPASVIFTTVFKHIHETPMHCLFRILILHHLLEIFLMKKKEMTAIIRQSRKADCSYLLRNRRNNEVHKLNDTLA